MRLECSLARLVGLFERDAEKLLNGDSHFAQEQPVIVSM